MRSDPTYDYSFDPEARNNTAAAVYRLAREGGPRILDLGSGPAVVSSYLKRVDHKTVTCVDGDAGRLEAANQRGVDRVIHADLEASEWATALEGERFDVVILADVLEHLKNPQRLLQLIREQRLLSPDGFLVISIPNAAHEAIVAELLSDRFRYREAGLLDATHIRFFTLDTFVDLLEGEGFVVAHLHRTLIPLERTEMQWVREGLDPALREALAALPEGQTYQFVVRAELGTESQRLKAVDRQLLHLRSENERFVASNEALAARERDLATARVKLKRISEENRRLKRTLSSVYASRIWKARRILVGAARFVTHPHATLQRLKSR